MIVDGNHKLICDLSTDACSAFDLAADAAERKNRIDEPFAAPLRARLDAWMVEESRFESSGSDPRAASAILDCARLGDAAVAHELPALLPDPFAESRGRAPARGAAARSPPIAASRCVELPIPTSRRLGTHRRRPSRRGRGESRGAARAAAPVQEPGGDVEIVLAPRSPSTTCRRCAARSIVAVLDEPLTRVLLDPARPQPRSARPSTRCSSRSARCVPASTPSPRSPRSATRARCRRCFCGRRTSPTCRCAPRWSRWSRRSGEEGARRCARHARRRSAARRARAAGDGGAIARLARARRPPPSSIPSTPRRAPSPAASCGLSAVAAGTPRCRRRSTSR